jgi:hypothetical protein
MQEKYGKLGFKVIAVNGMDDPREKVKKFVEKEKLKHTILLMGGKIADDIYGAVVYPSNYWIDHTGKVLRREEGFSPFQAREMEKRLERLLVRRNKKQADRGQGFSKP